MAMGKRKRRQDSLFLATEDLARVAGPSVLPEAQRTAGRGRVRPLD